MYAHSNEVEEIGVISLNGVNIESNPDMEALLGVSGRLPRVFDRTCQGAFSLTHASSIHLEKVHVHAVHVLELVCVGCAKPEGAPGLDHEARPDPPSFQLVLY